MSEDSPVTPAEVPPLSAVIEDPWRALAAASPSRLALGRAGSALPTRHVLDLALAHALARDAVHDGLDSASVVAAAEALGLAMLTIESAAPDRATYLRRPDFGRRLSRRSRTLLEDFVAAAPGSRTLLDDGVAAAPAEEARAAHYDVALVVGDGLSATAVKENAGALLEHLVPRLRAMGLGLAPLAIATQARVALADEVGQILGARLVVILIGERPGLSAADSLGAYLTFAPSIGRTDADRNCVSNIRKQGLPPPEAAAKIAWLIEHAFSLGLTGVGLKDGSATLLPSEPRRVQLPESQL